MAMYVIFSADTGEAELNGSRAELSDLARQLRSGDAVVQLDSVADPDPYDVALERVVISGTDQPVVEMVVSGDSKTLRLAGDERSLALVGDNLESFAKDSEGMDDHLHLEYYPGHFYLAPDSTSLVVRVSR